MAHVEIRPGDRIALLVPGSAEYVDLVMGLLAAGMFPVPLDPRLTASERVGILDDGELLCSHHHHRAHDARFRLERLASGNVRFHPRR